MGICWYCYWGWPKQVRDVYEKYAALVSDSSDVLDYGPGHVVWADENFDTECIQSCIDDAEKWRRHDWDANWPEDMQTTGLLLDDQDFMLAVDSLKELLRVPESVRCCVPDDYDDEHPELYPPTPELLVSH